MGILDNVHISDEEIPELSRKLHISETQCKWFAEFANKHWEKNAWKSEMPNYPKLKPGLSTEKREQVSQIIEGYWYDLWNNFYTEQSLEDYLDSAAILLEAWSNRDPENSPQWRLFYDSIKSPYFTEMSVMIGAITRIE